MHIPYVGVFVFTYRQRTQIACNRRYSMGSCLVADARVDRFKTFSFLPQVNAFA